jgi:hypothetical protein
MFSRGMANVYQVASVYSKMAGSRMHGRRTSYQSKWCLLILLLPFPIAIFITQNIHRGNERKQSES